MKNVNKIFDQYEIIIDGDPTLRFILREVKMDYKNLMNQVNIKIAASKIAFARYLDHQYPTKN